VLPVDAAALYSPKTGLWTNLNPIVMTTRRGGHTATLINKGPNSGKVLICGGQTNVAGAPVITNSCELFTPNPGNPLTGSFAAAQGMSSERMGHTASSIAGGRVFASGGRRWDAANSTWTYLSTNEIYNPDNDQWQPVTALASGRAEHTAVVLNNGNILISGGFNGANRFDAPEEYWYRTAAGMSQQQTAGSRGFMESAEIFDSNGGRVPITGDDFSVMPYRVARHSAVLLPDGTQQIYGGYGNIPPTFFEQSPTLEPGSQVNTQKTNTMTANVLPSSILRYLLEFNLSRPVSGRLVDADLYFPDYLSEVPSISVANAEIYINRGRSVADSMGVGGTIGYGGGVFKNVVLFDSPTGTAVFSRTKVSADKTPATAGSTFIFVPNPIPPKNPAVPLSAGSILNLSLTIPVPRAYVGGIISGTMTITGGQVLDDALGYWNVNLLGGSAPFTSGVVTDDVLNGTGWATGNISFTSLVGEIINSTETALSSPRNPTGDFVRGLSLTADYTSTVIDVSDAKFTLTGSSMIVREMIFADALAYNPATAKWEFGPTVFPIFNHSTLVTPGADAFIIGGRNCELAPDPDCLRANKTFTASASGAAYIEQNNNNWQTAGKLGHKRAFHSSTLLANGKILACGGSDGTVTLDSCELFDPATAIWTAAGPMTSPRSRHTATMLPNGRVLAAGGTVHASTQVIATAEIYYPDTNRWIAINSMVTPRANHSAVLMPDGNVLVAGGDTINGYTNTSEIYLTTSSVWINAGNLGTGRAQHTATLLRNGNVLATGGINGTGGLRSTEIFDFTSRTWSAGTNMVSRRYGHTANLLMDGRVMVIGGSDGISPLETGEIYAGANWSAISGMLVPRANHRTTLLPNGKLLLTGGERPGIAHSVVEGYDVDFSTFQTQGGIDNRTNHTAVLTSSNMVVVAGGWNGSQYLDSTQLSYFSYYPDSSGYPSAIQRNPLVSTATAILDRGDRLTLLSDTSNFHGISEAAGGGAGAMNASHHNPRVYLQQIDSPSGYLLDMTTRLYTLYGGPNSTWDKTVSSITITLPPNAWEMPYGWYHARVAANGQFSPGIPVQVSQPRPAGVPTAPTASNISPSSITWSWTNGGVATADGYAIYASSDGVFISTIAFGAAPSYTQTNLQPNTIISIKVNAYNTGGGGPLAQSSTYYTLASSPTFLAVTQANFTTASLAWGDNNNSPYTQYELSMCKDSNFANPVAISTPIPFNLNYTSTSATVTSLSADKMYYFRVRARNGAGVTTEFQAKDLLGNTVSTITVSAMNNFSGTAVSTHAINWAWSASDGADYYELFDITVDTSLPVFVGSTTFTDLTQDGLLANVPHLVSARAAKNNPGFGAVYGPLTPPQFVYSLASPPLPHPTDPFIDVTTGSFTMNWLDNGNSTWTVYRVSISTASDFTANATSTVSVVGTTRAFGKLGANTRYYVKLAAINGDGVYSSYLSMGTKYTLARAPAGVTPTDIQMSGVTIAWDKNNNSPETIYEVRGTTGSFLDTVVTHLPFYLGYTGNTHTMSGLLTATTYYFDVAAKNGEGIMSPRAQAVPAAFTTPGPAGSPAGSIGGVASPTVQTVISGTLPNARSVTLTVPPGSFPVATAIAVSSSVRSSCGSYTVCGQTVDVEVFSQNAAQPQVPVTLQLGYGCTIPDTSKLVIARYNEVSGECLPLETRIDPGARTITATLNHFSEFQLMLRTASTSLTDVKIYPNPFRTNRGNGFMTIANMPAGASVRLYTLSGDKVWEGTADGTGIIIWRGVNKSGQLVASGVYLAVIDSSAGKKVFKLAVER
jgi:N-acetylneuraminic acid mutarotase